jgi:glycosyltransferase involved in cell wall biosynthesis
MRDSPAGQRCFCGREAVFGFMNIVIDAFNLGFLNGTGLTAYTRELSDILMSSGHNVYPVYGLPGVKHIPNIIWQSFLQRLAVSGEPKSRDFLKWGQYALFNLPLFLLNYPVKAHAITRKQSYSSDFLRERLPAFKYLFNSPGIYRAVQLYSYVAKKTMYINLGKDIHADIVHMTSPLPVSIKNTRHVVTVHDLIPLSLPHSTSVNIKHYYNMISASIARADIIFSVSENTKKDILQYFRIAESKIHVTYQSRKIPDYYLSLGTADIVNVLKIWKLKYKEYFLFYGNIEPKKNVLFLLESFIRSKTNFSLVIIANTGWLNKAEKQFLKDRTFHDRIITINYVSYNNLWHIVSGARALIFPSLYEGFGLPVLEAMQLQCPVITSNITSLPEVGGDAVHYIDPFSQSDLISAIEKLSIDDHYCSDLSRRGVIQSEKFSIEKHKNSILDGYCKVLN